MKSTFAFNCTKNISRKKKTLLRDQLYVCLNFVLPVNYSFAMQILQGWYDFSSIKPSTGLIKWANFAYIL